MRPAPFRGEDDLCRAARQYQTPLVRVYRYPKTAVVIGRGGRPDRELNLEMIQADGMPLLRRRGGGCAVVLDPGNVILALGWPLPGVGGITTAFERISAWLIERLAACGAPGVCHRGVSDLALGDRKIGGSCIYRTRGLLYYTTTILVRPQIPLMTRYLQHPPREPGYRRGRPHARFVTSLAAAGLARDPDRLARQLAEAAQWGPDGKPIPG